MYDRAIRIAVAGCILSALMCTGVCVAQGPDYSNVQLRTDLRAFYRLTGKWAVEAELGLRRQVTGATWNSLYVNSSARYKVSDLWVLRGGLRVDWLDAVVDGSEIRPWEGVQLLWPTFGLVTLEHYFRLEQRFVSVEGGDAEFFNRFRYRITAETDDRPVFGMNRPSFALVAYEFFSNVNKISSELFLRSDRFYLGVGHKATENWTFQLQYYFQRSRIGTEEKLEAHDHVLRLRVAWTIR